MEVRGSGQAGRACRIKSLGCGATNLLTGLPDVVVVVGACPISTTPNRSFPCPAVSSDICQRPKTRTSLIVIYGTPINNNNNNSNNGRYQDVVQDRPLDGAGLGGGSRRHHGLHPLEQPDCRPAARRPHVPRQDLRVVQPQGNARPLGRCHQAGAPEQDQARAAQQRGGPNPRVLSRRLEPMG